MSWGLGILVIGLCLASYAAFLMRLISDEVDGNASGDATWGFLLPIAAWVTLGSLGLGAASLVPTWGLGGVALMAVVLVLAVPWPLALAVAVPLGWPRTAYVLARLSTVRARRDPVGLAMVVAARAASRQAQVDRAVQAWIVGRRKKRPVTPGMVMALGLLAASRGDREEARHFLDVLPLFDARVADPTVVRWSREWLVAEAAQRGAWAEVEERAGKLGPTTPAIEWLGAVAQRLLGSAEGPSDDRLELLWRKVAGRARTTWLHERALRTQAPRKHDEPLPDDPVEAALQADLRLQASPSADRLDRSARCWEAALPTLEDQVRDRAIALGSHQPDRAVARFREQVSERLQAASEHTGTAVPAVGGLSARAGGQRREALLRSVELAARALEQRLERGGVLPAPDELREWLALKSLIAEVEQLGGVEMLRVAFRPVYGPCCTLSVRLYNDDNEPWLSNAMTRWLLHLAHRAGDQRAVALQTKNLTAVSSL